MRRFFAVRRVAGLSGLCLLALCLALGCDGPAGEPLTWQRVLAETHKKFPDVRFISTGELADWLADPDRPPPLLLDVRQAQEYQVSHLPGAVLATPGPPMQRALVGVDQDSPIVVYCSVGYRSAEAARELGAMGYTRVSNLDGSIFAWANEGRALVYAGGRADKVHPYDQTWGVLLAERYHPDVSGSGP